MWKIKTVMKKIVRSFAIAASAALIGAASLPAAAEQAVQTSAVETTAEETWMDAMYADLSELPAYSDSPYYVLNDNVPYFSEADFTTESFESYGDLDSLGRCTTAYACLGLDTMPTEERGRIGMIKPSGWHLVKYDGIDGNYLYNRCHLIGYQLSGENANEKNLITGTRYMSVQGMEPFEDETADYIKDTGNHVLYRVTPYFGGDNLLSFGVVMEAESVEDRGAGVEFCVFCYNVQLGIAIDYATGDSSGPEYTGTENTENQANTNTQQTTASQIQSAESAAPVSPEAAYIGNANTMKFHRPDCPSVSQMADHNKIYLYSREEAVSQGYEPCKRCNP